MTTANDRRTAIEPQPTTHEASTHTPAPWLENVGVSRHPRIIGGHRLLLIATTESSQVTLEERSANARLIAAAPELLEELHKWIDEDVVIERYLRLLEREQLDDEDARWVQRYEQTRAAIAKAEGQS